MVVSKVTDDNNNNKINQDRRRKVLIVVARGQRTITITITETALARTTNLSVVGQLKENGNGKRRVVVL